MRIFRPTHSAVSFLVGIASSAVAAPLGTAHVNIAQQRDRLIRRPVQPIVVESLPSHAFSYSGGSAPYADRIVQGGTVQVETQFELPSGATPVLALFNFQSASGTESCSTSSITQAGDGNFQTTCAIPVGINASLGPRNPSIQVRTVSRIFSGYSDYGYSVSLNRSNCGISNIRCVPEQHSTISAAISAAQPGDIIGIGSGSWAVTPELQINKPLTIVGHPSVPTVLDVPNGSNNRIFNVTSSNVLILDLNLQNASASYLGHGGAVYIEAASGQPWLTSILFDHVKFLNNGNGDGGGILTGYGGGIFARNVADVLVNRCTFDRNGAEIAGGAIALEHVSNARMVNSIFGSSGSNSKNESLGVGGAVDLTNVGHVSIVGSFFSFNQAPWGGAISQWQDTELLEIRNNTFMYNNALARGGVLYLEPTTLNAVVEKSRFVDNRSESSSTPEIDGGRSINFLGSESGGPVNLIIRHNNFVQGLSFQGSLGVAEVVINGAPAQNIEGAALDNIFHDVSPATGLETFSCQNTVPGEPATLFPITSHSVRFNFGIGTCPLGTIDMSEDPEFVDTNYLAVEPGSPTVNNASDGGNIGVWQGFTPTF